MTICLVEDDPVLGRALFDRLNLEGLRTRWFTRAGEAAAAMASDEYLLVICDIRLPDQSGDALYEQLLVERRHLPPFIFITAYGEVERAVKLIRLGAVDYLTKPFKVDHLLDRVREHLGPGTPTGPETTEECPLGISRAMRDIDDTLRRLATLRIPLLITGETGVGKEVVARRMHDLGSQGPFVALNCAALAEGLAESEIFGHEKGAFTGALRAHQGVFERARGGTLFLDEIGDMPMALQAKLLRVLQDQSFTRVGGERALPVEARLVCATHRDLPARIAEGTFREDLYYRINGAQVHIPALRERPEDIGWLAGRFLQRYRVELDRPRLRLHPDAEQAMLTHAWPGNVRELGHCLQRASVFARGETLRGCNLLGKPGIVEEEPEEVPLREYVQASERRYIQYVLESEAGRIGAAAARLGISRKVLWEKMRRLGM